MTCALHPILRERVAKGALTGQCSTQGPQSGTFGSKIARTFRDNVPKMLQPLERQRSQTQSLEVPHQKLHPPPRHRHAVVAPSVLGDQVVATKLLNEIGKRRTRVIP